VSRCRHGIIGMQGRCIFDEGHSGVHLPADVAKAVRARRSLLYGDPVCQCCGLPEGAERARRHSTPRGLGVIGIHRDAASGDAQEAEQQG
jgi:hypothetical protein